MAIQRIWRALDTGCSVLLGLAIVIFSPNADTIVIEIGEKQADDMKAGARAPTGNMS